MKTKVFTNEEIKQLIAEIFFNKQSNITKISDESATNALFFGLGRAGQMATKDIALVESIIFPQSATSSNLDKSGDLFASLGRNNASKSSTYLLIVGSVGTVYPQATTTFTSTSGVAFELIEDFTIGSFGYGYAKVRSKETGAASNVDAVSITKVSPEPSGHSVVTNEFKAIGGRDSESDEDYRQRIYSHPNRRSQKTLAFLAEIFRDQNDDVLFLQNLGYTEDGLLNVSVVLQNGADLTVGELSSLLDSVSGYFALTDLNKIGDTLGIKLVNPTWYAVGDPLGDGSGDGIDFRVSLLDNYDTDQVRKNIQIAIARYLDIRDWKSGGTIEWDDLLGLVKDIEGVKYVPDEFFKPSVDEVVPDNQLPRVKRFVMRDLNGNIISDNSGTLSPIFYPNN